jgi:predicted ribosome-associated RNA-binding protein Tma20
VKIMIELPSENTLDNHSVGNQIKLGRAFSDLRRIVNKKNGNALTSAYHIRDPHFRFKP